MLVSQHVLNKDSPRCELPPGAKNEMSPGPMPRLWWLEACLKPEATLLLQYGNDHVYEMRSWPQPTQVLYHPK